MTRTAPDIIIKRSSRRQMDQPKGGIWKIAHADFMTAMMALFLVLWLINSTNQETRASVAQYFNPVKLSSTTLDRKGVRTPHDAEPGQSETPGDSKQDDPGARSSGQDRRPSAAIKTPGHQATAPFQDPYTILAEVSAARAESGQDRASALTLGTTGRPGMNGGEALRDPFDPTFWRLTPSSLITPETASERRPVDAMPGGAAAGKAAPNPGKNPAEKASEPSSDEIVTATVPGAEPVPPAGLPNQERAEDLGRAIAAALAAGDADAKPDAKRGDSKGEGKPASASAPKVDVRQTDEGLLISLTDDVNFGMFAIGSADPKPETVQAMSRVASVLKDRTGTIVIRGHTDARPFRTRTNNNWKLSTDRAHIAHDLLVAAGIEEARIEHIEGYASRRLRSSDPEAAENRRIEILLRESGT